MNSKWFKLALACMAGGTLIAGTQQACAGGVLLATKTTQAPTLDGVVDTLWSKALPLTIPVYAGRNLPGGKTSVTVKALYTNDMVYFLAQYKDSTQSLMRHPWQKQADGSWKKLKTPNAEDDENRYFEDRLALLWNISTPAFETQGCMAACHQGEKGKAYGNKYTPGSGQKLDLWHIKSVRTVPVGQGDDQYVDNTKFNAIKSPDAGRKGDPNTGGGYKDNENAGKTQPLYALLGNKVAPPYWILDAKKVAFDNTKYKVGDKVPSILVAPFKGDRASLSAKMTWKNGVWTYEIARKRVTGSPFDVQFKDATKAYAFGVSIFDNAEVRHAYDLGVETLKFKP
jgi:hypothetical protein